MAGRDYILCADCGEKLVYDSGGRARTELEVQWGDINASTWTVPLLCPPCLAKLRSTVIERDARIVELERKLADQDDECVTLIATIDRLQQHWAENAPAAQYRAERDALLADAQRYRTVRNGEAFGWLIGRRHRGFVAWVLGLDADAAIDAARKDASDA